MSCGETDNVICKHASATMTFYLDMNDRLPTGVTITAVAATVSGDETLVVESVGVLDEDLTIQEGTACTERVLLADRAVLVRLSGGTPGDDEVIISIECTRSDGDIDVVDCRLSVVGAS